MSQLLLTIDEAADALRLGRTTIFKHVNAGTLRDVRISGRRFIAREEIERVTREGLPLPGHVQLGRRSKNTGAR